MMKKMKWAVAALMVVIGTSCQKEATVDPILTDSDFRASTDGWTADYTDYGIAQESLIEFQFKRTALPAPLDATKQALLIAGHNRSDDLFLFLKKKVTGLRANTVYNLRFDLELASSAAEESFGIGGSPSSSVYLKVGASATEPQKVREGDDFRLTIDKGQQAAGGKDMIVVGNLSNGTDKTDYALITRNNKDQVFSAQTNDKGELWLVVGTDSGFEGNTVLYYNHIKVTIQ